MTAVALPQYALLRFSGADAQPFLHGQLTCDLQALKTGSATYGGYCNPKGRLLATFLIWADAAGYTMLLPAALAESIRKRLTLYILRAKVKAESLDAAYACVGITGADVDGKIAAVGGTPPAGLLSAATAGESTTIGLHAGRCLLVLPRAQASAIAPAADSAWELQDIIAGIPFILPATQEEFVPQMVNLDLIGALSYTKGCYPGQEIVARTHYLGKLKQRMYRARVAAAAAPGDKLYCAGLGEQAAGMVVTAAPAADGHEVLAVLQTAHAQSEPCHLGSLQGPRLVLDKLPYQNF